MICFTSRTILSISTRGGILPGPSPSEGTPASAPPASRSPEVRGAGEGSNKQDHADAV
jgi:hypothetical protein